DPDQPVSTLPLLTPVERQQILVEWNATRVQHGREEFVHQLFEAWSARTPDVIAAVHKDEHLTYQELNRRANQLAHSLRGLGARPESLVGICLERSFDLLICLIGILKAGGAYLLLDSTYPLARLAWMLEDAGVSLLLTTHRLGEPLARTEMRLLCLEDEWEHLARQHATNPTGEIDPDNLLYVIYTSGSTGQPKGVQVTQRGLQNLVCWHQQAFELTTHDRASQFASLSFDGAIWEIWPALTAGATLCLIDDERRNDPQQVREWLVE